MATITISSSAQLVSALASATAGDVISLNPGTYSAIALSNLSFTAPVTITSADAANPAVLTGLTVRNSSNLTFSNVDLVGQANGSLTDFEVSGSSHVTFDRVEVSGPALGGAGVKPFGLRLRDSSDVKVTNSEFHDVTTALYLLNNAGVVVADNAFHDLSSDGVQSAGSTQVTISDNLFTDFHPPAGSHPDAIQFFTLNTTTVPRDITITGNVVVRGDGDPAQGIFVSDQIGLTYVNVTIAENLLIGTMFNAIALQGATSGSVTDNVVLGFADMVAYLRVEASQVSLTGNSATAWVTTTNGSGLPAGNTRAAVPTDAGIGALGAWLETYDALNLASGPVAAQLKDILHYDPTALPVTSGLYNYAIGGYMASLGIPGHMIGTDDSQYIVLADAAGSVVLDESFGRGNDLLDLPGRAADYQIALSGSSAILTRGASTLVVPVTLNGVALSFTDGMRELVYDLAAGSAKIGGQSITATAATVTAAPDLTPMLTGGIALAGGENDVIIALAHDFSAHIEGNHLVLTPDTPVTPSSGNVLTALDFAGFGFHFG